MVMDLPTTILLNGFLNFIPSDVDSNLSGSCSIRCEEVSVCGRASNIAARICSGVTGL
jgi:hypothetical protein